jgi:hypothetical protein
MIVDQGFNINRKMKYTRLTKEQFEELTQEFTNFFYQTIDKAEWDSIKAEKPEVAERIDIFSDLVWEGVLTKAEYLEHFSKNHIFFSVVLTHMLIQLYLSHLFLMLIF